MTLLPPRRAIPILLLVAAPTGIYCTQTSSPEPSITGMCVPVDNSLPEWSGTLLHEAIRGGDAAAVARLLRAAMNPNERDAHGNPGLVIALFPVTLLEPLGPGDEQARRAAIQQEQATRERIVAELLRAGADPRLAGRGGITPLIAVAQWGYTPDADVRLIRDLVGRGADVNVQNADGDTALIVAAQRGKKAVVDTLLSVGALRDVKNCRGQTAQAVAEAGGKTDIAHALSH